MHLIKTRHINTDNNVTFQPIPPYLGFGSPEDSLQSCLTVTIPHSPKKDIVQYMTNVSKVSSMERNMIECNTGGETLSLL
jgi:hypothetical protein